MDFVTEARTLVQNLNQRMGPSAYDMAWMARLRTDGGDARWPDLMDWLLDHQHPNGSWGGKIAYYHDRIICTLAVAIALRENGRTPRVQTAIARAERYVWHQLHWLPRDPFELVGFELILPTLLLEARELGLDVPTHTCGYGEIQTAKLRLIPLELLYSPRLSTVYSMEFLGRSGDPDRMRQALTSTGALGNSPAATAYYLWLCHDDEQALAYLERVRRHMGHVITFYPFRTFELGWVLNNLILCGLPIRELVSDDTWEALRKEIEPDGVGFDSTFGIPDGDTTSICCRVLLEAGYPVAPSILGRFENRDKHIFRTYDYERNVSIGTNVHALEAVDLMLDYPEREQVQEQVMLMLLDNRKYNMYWTDKWHASPYYATAHALVALLRESAYVVHACRPTVDWLVHTQRADGSWGFFERGTAEETAYVLTALLHYNRFEAVNRAVLDRGAAYLVRAHQEGGTNYPELWIAKCLYTPVDIVRSAILAALILYTDTFGRCP